MSYFENNRILPCLLGVVLLLAGCGGGSSGNGGGGGGTPPPPAGDFTLVLDVLTMSAQQQGVSQGQNVYVTPVNGFTGTVTITMSGLPAGVTVAPAGPYSISSTGNQSASFYLAASSAAAVATSTITVTGTSGSITHTKNFTLAVTPIAPFSIQVNPASLSLQPAALQRVQISVTATGGATLSLFTSVSSPPNDSGVTVNPPEALLTPTSPVSFSVVASALPEALQNFPLQISASDNSGNTNAVTLPLTVSVPSATLGITRSSFLFTGNGPSGAVYDQARKLVFVTVQSLNAVEVYSSTNGNLLATIPVEQPFGIDETADGTKVIVGAQSAYISVIDPNLLQVIQRVRTPLAPNPPAGETDYYFLLQPATLANGDVLFAAQHGYTTECHVFLWDPGTGTMTLEDFPDAIIFAQTLTRSQDHSKVFVYGNSSTGATGALYDAASNSYVSNGSFAGAYYVALSPDGSQLFAAGIQGNATAFYNDSLQQLAALTLEMFPVSGTHYSRDGQHVYVSGTLMSDGNVIGAINTQTYAVEGLVPDVAGGIDATIPYDIDETGMLFGAGADGIAEVDVSSPGFFSTPTPALSPIQPPLLNPLTANPVQLTGAYFDPSASYGVYFGAPPAAGANDKGTGVSVQSSTVIDVTAPAQALQGPINVTLTRASDGWSEVLPVAATYGPSLVAAKPNAGPASGGATAILYGYGLGAPGAQVTIGGKPAQVAQPSFPSIAFSFGALAVTAPAGTPGYADITVTTPAGSTTIPSGFQYLQSAVIYPVSGALDDIVYDQARQKLYATNQPLNRVEVFDLASQTYLSPIAVGNAPTGLAMTPDGTLLAVVNSADGTVSKINLASGQLAATYSALASNDSNPTCGGAAVSIAPVAPHLMLIDGVCNALAFSGFIDLLNLDTGALSCTGFVTCSTDGADLSIGSGLDVMASTPDGEKIFMTDVSQDTGGEGALVTLIDVAANTAAQNEFGGYDAAASGDGTIFATGFGFHDANNIQFNVASDYLWLGAAANSLVNIVGEKLNPSGSLLFVPEAATAQANGLALGVDIFDVHDGRLALRVILPEAVPPSLNAMVLDETGTKMFVISNSGITIATLFEAPLSLAYASPASAAPGTQVTLRGSGFESGSIVQFGASTAAATFVDAQTLQVTVPNLSNGPTSVTISNPSGASYTFDAAFTVD